MNAIDILERLVGFPSVVGTANGDIAGWIADYLESHGAKVSLLAGPEGDRANLFASFGPTDASATFDGGELAAVPELAGLADDVAVVVHITDAQAGEVSVYVDDQHLTFTDRTRYQAQLVPEPTAPRFRFAWDDEISSYGYKCRTQTSGFVGPDNPPAVLRFYKEPREGNDYRVNLTKDPAWGWRDTIIALNGGGEEGERRFDYWVNKNTAQFNTTGWAQMAYLGMSGNEIKVIERVGDWVRFETLRPTDWYRARSMSIATHSTLIHRFTCVSWKDGKTVRIPSTGTPRGQVYFPLVTAEGSAWIPERFVVGL